MRYLLTWLSNYLFPQDRVSGEKVETFLGQYSVDFVHDPEKSAEPEQPTDPCIPIRPTMYWYDIPLGDPIISTMAPAKVRENKFILDINNKMFYLSDNCPWVAQVYVK